MKYTRYDLRKKRNNMLSISIVIGLTLVFAFLIGSIVSNVFIKSSDTKSTPKEVVDKPAGDTKTADMDKTANFIVIQGGLFANKQYMEQTKAALAGYGNPFVIEEQKGNRVLLGIYTETEGQNMIKSLTEKGIANSKMTFQIENSDLCNAEISGIISATVQVLTELTKKDVKSIQTDELKKWTSALKEPEKSSTNIEVLDDLKKYVSNLPKEIGKDKASENYVFIYNTLKKFQANN